MEMNAIKQMEQKRREDNEKMQKISRLMKLPTYGLLVPIVKLADAFGLSDNMFRAIGRRMMDHFHMDKSFEGYEPTERDVIVSAYFKSGTNWTLQITHQIAHLGQGDFNHLHDVIPWPDGMPGFSIDIGHDDVWQKSPTGLRIIKSHLPLKHIPFKPEARYICVIRDPKDVAVSGYHFIRDTTFGPLTLSLENYLPFYLSSDFPMGTWASHLHSFWQKRHEKNVLFLTYKEMKQNPEQIIRRIANFMGVTLTDEAFAQVVEQSSFDYMRSINHKFFPGRTTPWSNPNGKMIRKGVVGDSASLFDKAQRKRIDEHFKQDLIDLGSDFPYDAFYGETPTAVSITDVELA